MRSFLLLTLVAVLSTGCTAFGRRQVDERISPQSVNRIKKGSSKDEVVNALGAPQEIVFSNREHDPLREHAYIYKHSTQKFFLFSLVLLTMGNADEKNDRVVVFFDEEGKVARVGSTLAAEKAAYAFPFGK